MKAYKIFRRYHDTDTLHSYNANRDEPLSIKYNKNEWNEAAIPGSGLYVTRRIEGRIEGRDDASFSNFSYEWWEVEIEGASELEDSFYIDVWENDLEGDLKKNIAAGKKAERIAIIEHRRDIFESTFVVDRVLPVAKIRQTN